MVHAGTVPTWQDRHASGDFSVRPLAGDGIHAEPTPGLKPVILVEPGGRETIVGWSKPAWLRRATNPQPKPLKSTRSLESVCRVMFNAARKNARKRGIDFDMTISDVLELLESGGGRCAVTGIQFESDKTYGAFRSPWRPSLDRIRSGGSYTRGNCRLVCCAVNIAMNEWGIDVLRRIAKALVLKGEA